MPCSALGLDIYTLTTHGDKTRPHYTSPQKFPLERNLHRPGFTCSTPNSRSAKPQHLCSVMHSLDQRLGQGFCSTSRDCTHSYSMLAFYIAFYLLVSRINTVKIIKKSTICHIGKKAKGALYKGPGDKGPK